MIRDAPFTLPFETFWSWLATHPNCILRGGTLQAVLYDDEDFYWHFANETDGTLLVQVLRGKRIVGEFFVDPEGIAYVQAVPGENEEEHTFELISEGETDRPSAYFFVLAHGYEGEPSFTPGRVH